MMAVVVHFLCTGRRWNWDARWCHVSLSQTLAQLFYHRISTVLASAVHGHLLCDRCGLLVVPALLGLYIGIERRGQCRVSIGVLGVQVAHELQHFGSGHPIFL